MSKAPARGERETYNVHLEAAELGIRERVGILHRNLRKEDLPASFQYAPSWDEHPGKFMLDPRLDLHSGEKYPNAGAPGFGIFVCPAWAYSCGCKSRRELTVGWRNLGLRNFRNTSAGCPF